MSNDELPQKVCIGNMQYTMAVWQSSVVEDSSDRCAFRHKDQSAWQ